MIQHGEGDAIRLCERCGALARFFHTTPDEVMLLCSDLECPWPLDEADDLKVYRLPASDEGVLRHAAEVQAAMAVTAVVRSRRQDSRDAPSDELQRIGNILFQPSPTCSPAIQANARSLPSLDSFPGSALIVPQCMEHEAAMSAFALPPAFPTGTGHGTGSSCRHDHQAPLQAGL